MKQITDMLHRIADGAMLVNEDGNEIPWNKAAERLLGFRSNISSCSWQKAREEGSLGGKTAEPSISRTEATGFYKPNSHAGFRTHAEGVSPAAFDRQTRLLALALA